MIDPNLMRQIENLSIEERKELATILKVINISDIRQNNVGFVGVIPHRDERSERVYEVKNYPIEQVLYIPNPEKKPYRSRYNHKRKF